MAVNRIALIWLLVAAVCASTVCSTAEASVIHASAWKAVVSPVGSLRLQYRGRDYATLEPGLFEAVWRGASLSPANPAAQSANGTARGTIVAPGGAVVDVETKTETVENGLKLGYRLTPRSDVKLNSLHVALAVPATVLAGGSYKADGKDGQIPAQFGSVHLFSGDIRDLEIAGRHGENLHFAFTQPAPVMIQDDRQWGPSFTVRIGPQMDADTAWLAGKSYAVEFVLTAKEGMAVAFDGPVTIKAGTEWIPLDVALDIEEGSALDFSNLVAWHQPAGKRGRVKPGHGGDLVFPDKPNEPIRFYGFNLCFTAQYLTHQESDRLATRFRRLGYNAVRLHHYESTLVDRSGGNSVTLNPSMLDRLDYLFHALKEQGIYITTDLYVSRPVFAREVWEGETGDVGMDEFKMAVPVNERAFANYTAFAKNLLGHVNPYTKMRWADDPALAWLNLINEGNPGNFVGSLTPRLRKDYEKVWDIWFAKKYPNRAAIKMPSNSDGDNDKLLAVFLAENQMAFYERTKKFLRNELKCNALLCNMNAWTNPVQIETVRSEFDYVDDHFYVDHPEFIERPWSLPSKCDNTSPVSQGAPGGRSCAFIRLLDRPFTCSEFNYSGPGKYRGVGGILAGALGSIQDWSVIWRFAYSHSRDNLFTPAPAGYFDMATDPLSQAADRASICLFRRGDMKPAPHSVAIAMTPDDTLKEPKDARGVVPGWNGVALLTRVGSVATGDPSRKWADMVLPLGWATPASTWSADAPNIDPYGSDAGDKIVAEMRKRLWLDPSNVTDVNENRFQSETGEMTVDAPNDRLTLDTARTAGGYARAGETVRAKVVSVKMEDTDATVWVSSVDGKPIANSKRLIITHLTDLQNTGARYADEARRILLDWGGMPHLVKSGRATVTIRLANPAKATVWGLTTGGKRTSKVDASVANGALIVPLDMKADGKARLVYEVVVAN